MGMAGTGGTSSPSSVEMEELRALFCFGGGSLAVGGACGARCCNEDADGLLLRLDVEPVDMPDVSDLRLKSGVALADEGVAEGRRGIIDGERESERLLIETGGGGGKLISWVKGWLCVVGIIDMRFMRRVSVGLIVLAPSPCDPGIMEARLPPEDGVVPRPPTLGDRVANEKRLASGVPRFALMAVFKFVWLVRDEGCTDLAFAALVFTLSLRVGSDPSRDVLVESEPPRSEIILGRLRC